jgi:hypothetical protein
MKKSSVILLVVLVSLSSCVINEKKETAKESGSTSFQPKPLDDEWSKWLIGKWQVTGGGSEFLGDELEDLGESNAEVAAGFIIESVLDGQFLIWKSWADTGETTDEQTQQFDDEQIQHLKETTNASVEEIEKFLSMPYESLQIQTIDPTTGERIAYFFDSLRCIAKGTGRLEGKKEIMEWQWSGASPGVTSVGIIEKINDNKFAGSMKYTLPDGNTMEEKIEMIRRKIETEK